jgi:hypothetical protein
MPVSSGVAMTQFSLVIQARLLSGEAENSFFSRSYCAIETLSFSVSCAAPFKLICSMAPSATAIASSLVP